MNTFYHMILNEIQLKQSGSTFSLIELNGFNNIPQVNNGRATGFRMSIGGRIARQHKKLNLEIIGKNRDGSNIYKVI